MVLEMARIAVKPGMEAVFELRVAEAASLFKRERLPLDGVAPVRGGARAGGGVG